MNSSVKPFQFEPEFGQTQEDVTLKIIKRKRQELDTVKFWITDSQETPPSCVILTQDGFSANSSSLSPHNKSTQVSSVSVNMNNSSDFGTCLPTAQPIAIPVLMCVVCFTGFLLNAFSLWVFCCRMSSWSAGTVLQFNLALSDAVGIPVSPLMAAYFALGNDWPFGTVLCTVKIALLSSQFLGSSIFLTLISVHRYTAVVHFNKSCRMKNKSFIKKLCAAVWLFLFAHSLAYGFAIPSTKVGKITQCISFSQRSLTNSFFVLSCVLVCIGFLLPLSISGTCYIRVTNALTRLNNITPKSFKIKLKSQRMIRMCLVIFGVCFLPMNVIRTTSVAVLKFSSLSTQCQVIPYLQTAYYASWVVAGLNCCLDPLLYYFGSQNFRDAVPSFHVKPVEIQQSDTEMTPTAASEDSAN
ncbi:hypothetical protein WMY93_004164 [Mugilogobius chulae]|uniref:G-protein coupled receptors family 1 profile domain-containing protein n=1 Tax=Mugilogobius chulae TaxID=88201 RepID=A0AAW0PZ33_9GOBI